MADMFDKYVRSVVSEDQFSDMQKMMQEAKKYEVDSKVTVAGDIYNCYFLTLLKLQRFPSMNGITPKLIPVKYDCSFFLNNYTGGWPAWVFCIQMLTCIAAVYCTIVVDVKWQWQQLSWYSWFMLMIALNLNRYNVEQKIHDCEAMTILLNSKHSLDAYEKKQMDDGKDGLLKDCYHPIGKEEIGVPAEGTWILANNRYPKDGNHVGDDRFKCCMFIIKMKFMALITLHIVTAFAVSSKSNTVDFLKFYAAFGVVSMTPELWFTAKKLHVQNLEWGNNKANDMTTLLQLSMDFPISESSNAVKYSPGLHRPVKWTYYACLLLFGISRMPWLHPYMWGRVKDPFS